MNDYDIQKAAMVRNPIRIAVFDDHPVFREGGVQDRMRVVHQPSLPRFDIYLARYTPAKLLGIVEARNADLAIVEAMKEFEISNPRRLIAVRRG
jgi:hypothetical protein